MLDSHKANQQNVERIESENEIKKKKKHSRIWLHKVEVYQKLR